MSCSSSSEPYSFLFGAGGDEEAECQEATERCDECQEAYDAAQDVPDDDTAALVAASMESFCWALNESCEVMTLSSGIALLAVIGVPLFALAAAGVALFDARVHPRLARHFSRRCPVVMLPSSGSKVLGRNMGRWLEVEERDVDDDASETDSEDLLYTLVKRKRAYGDWLEGRGAEDFLHGTEEDSIDGNDDVEPILLASLQHGLEDIEEDSEEELSLSAWDVPHTLQQPSEPPPSWPTEYPDGPRCRPAHPEGVSPDCSPNGRPRPPTSRSRERPAPPPDAPLAMLELDPIEQQGSCPQAGSPGVLRTPFGPNSSSDPLCLRLNMALPQAGDDCQSGPPGTPPSPVELKLHSPERKSSKGSDSTAEGSSLRETGISDLETWVWCYVQSGEGPPDAWSLREAGSGSGLSDVDSQRYPGPGSEPLHPQCLGGDWGTRAAFLCIAWVALALRAIHMLAIASSGHDRFVAFGIGFLVSYLALFWCTASLRARSSSSCRVRGRVPSLHAYLALTLSIELLFTLGAVHEIFSASCSDAKERAGVYFGSGIFVSAGRCYSAALAVRVQRDLRNPSVAAESWDEAESIATKETV